MVLLWFFDARFWFEMLVILVAGVGWWMRKLEYKSSVLPLSDIKPFSLVAFAAIQQRSIHAKFSKHEAFRVELSFSKQQCPLRLHCVTQSSGCLAGPKTEVLIAIWKMHPLGILIHE